MQGFVCDSPTDVCVDLYVTLALPGLWALNIKLWNEKFWVFRLSYFFENFFHYSEPYEFLWVLRCRCQFLSKRCWNFGRSPVKPVGQVSSLEIHSTHEADSFPFIYIYFKCNKATWFLAYKSCWLVLEQLGTYRNHRGKWPRLSPSFYQIDL